jgi:hypothetical protein
MPAPREFLYRVLHHTGIPDPHYDLLLETSKKARLPTWRFPAWPIEKPTRVTRLEDHRRRYLSYTGKIDGNRGSVATKDFGIHQTERTRGHWVVRFRSGLLGRVGGVELVQLDSETWEARPLRHRP